MGRNDQGDPRTPGPVLAAPHSAAWGAGPASAAGAVTGPATVGLVDVGLGGPQLDGGELREAVRLSFTAVSKGAACEPCRVSCELSRGQPGWPYWDQEAGKETLMNLSCIGRQAHRLEDVPCPPSFLRAPVPLLTGSRGCRSLLPPPGHSLTPHKAQQVLGRWSQVGCCPQRHLLAPGVPVQLAGM